ncbi:LOW QUALITY PROTEIN: hypothetical protein CRUP_013689 [Coryphaenoides rupestris]|nr:LOW QUALITY PROTEIN: hypothetical protein CRUP_013689 [Coryphaenoides rupestris]
MWHVPSKRSDDSSTSWPLGAPADRALQDRGTDNALLLPTICVISVPSCYAKVLYTIWNFVPKNLFEQFRRIANFYFIIIFLVQLMIDTPTSPITSGLPLFFVITVTAVKQADNEVNGAPVFVVRSGSLVQTRSKNIRGTCHITTASLDGETNLKVCGADHRDPTGGGDCVAVYTGMESKMALNYKCKSQKRSAVEKSMNTFLIIYLCILLFEAVLSTILKYAWQAESQWNEPFYNQMTEQERNSSPILKFISDFLAFLVLYNYIIPISLYVTVEMQKFLGSFFIGWDMDLYHEESDQKAQVNTSDLNEELGQVEYVFTDKTGTLTENEMHFRECSINGTKYQELNGKLVPEGMMEDSLDGSNATLTGEELLFLKAVSLCHTVQISYDQPDRLGGAGDPFAYANGFSASQMEYYASSPDEKALVEATKRIGVAFNGSNGETMEIKTFGMSEKYKMLHVLEFDANRRRMSVILESPSGGKVLFTKGAESAILPFSTSGEIEKTRLHVDEFALKGLRTLVVACRHFSVEEYSEVERQLTAARTALQQREERLQAAFAFIERDLHLLGATGVEDRLQDKVQETIEALRLAGIKVWVLTGDKHETAVSVSLSCGHFHRTMNILELLQQHTDNECAEQLRLLARRIKEDNVIQHGLVVDGASLSLALREHEKLFMDVCKNCSAVLCCRMAPLQKAKVVHMFKTSPEKPITLAIGDGANDVSMIQEAHNVCFITPQFLYQFFCLFSQQTLYDSAYLTLYNIFFTSLPILVYSLFEQLVHPHVLQTKPALYRDISRNSLLSFRTFLYWTLLGFCHAFIFFFGSYALIGEETSLMGNGQMFGNWTFGALVYTVMVITVTLQLALETHYWTWMNHFVTWGSIAFYFIFSLFYGGIIWPFVQTQDMYFVFVQLLSSGSVWFAMVIIVVTCLFPDMLKKVLYRHLHPTGTQKSQMYSNRVVIGDDFIALQPLSRAKTQLGKISLYKPSRRRASASLCCYQHGQSGCARLARLLEQMTGPCPGGTAHCNASNHSSNNRSWGDGDNFYSNDRSILTLSPIEATHC